MPLAASQSALLPVTCTELVEIDFFSDFFGAANLACFSLLTLCFHFQVAVSSHLLLELLTGDYPPLVLTLRVELWFY